MTEPGAGPDRDAMRRSLLTAWLRDILVAARVLTMIPLPIPSTPSEAAVALSRRAFPVVGLALGFAGALLYTVLIEFNLSPFASAFVTLGALIAVTGARGEVALAIFAEGIGRGGDPAARAAIMAEARLGYYGVLALFFGIILRAALLATTGRSGAGAAVLIAAVTGSRAVIPFICDRFRRPGGDGLGGLALDAGRDQIWLASALGILLILLFLGPLAGLVAAAAAIAAALGTAWLARRVIGGLNPPAVGTVQQVTETAILLVAAAFS